MKGDLLVETTPDEEFASSNGTVAARARGYFADAAVITEPTNMSIVIGQRGFRMAQVAISGADIVRESTAVMEEVTGQPVNIVTGFVPCDLFVFNKYCGIPAIVMGPIGDNAHAPDEYTEMESMIKCVEVYMNLAIRWCGVA